MTEITREGTCFDCGGILLGVAGGGWFHESQAESFLCPGTGTVRAVGDDPAEWEPPESEDDGAWLAEVFDESADDYARQEVTG